MGLGPWASGDSATHRGPGSQLAASAWAADCGFLREAPESLGSSFEPGHTLSRLSSCPARLFGGKKGYSEHTWCQVRDGQCRGRAGREKTGLGWRGGRQGSENRLGLELPVLKEILFFLIITS